MRHLLSDVLEAQKTANRFHRIAFDDVENEQVVSPIPEILKHLSVVSF